MTHYYLSKQKNNQCCLYRIRYRRTQSDSIRYRRREEHTGDPGVGTITAKQKPTVDNKNTRRKEHQRQELPKQQRQHL